MYKVGHLSAPFSNILPEVIYSILWQMVTLWSLVEQNIIVIEAMLITKINNLENAHNLLKIIKI